MVFRKITHLFMYEKQMLITKRVYIFLQDSILALSLHNNVILKSSANL